jgi:2-polyprenyl-6-methoxyphenol hydroxylase-like FAD-dependent oxidoreductase
MGVREISVRCCIAGGGPAGMMLGLLLARAGVTVLVLEKHVDFLRDFRGDTIHPSTLEIMHELGVLDEFLQRPHQEVRTLGTQVGEVFLQVADFEHLPTHCRFVALMPQWDFLNFIAEQAKRYPGFRLEMEAEATTLIEEGGRVTGLRAETSQGSLAVRADLVVGADGRHSIVREKAGLEITNLGAPMDVLWMRLSRHPSDPEQTLGRVDAGRIFVMLNRGDYWQCAYVIPKGGFDQIRRSGLTAFRDEVMRLAPYLSDRSRRTRRLVGHQVADCCRRSAACLAPVRLVVHRRCGSRHVTDRWGGHKSRDPGRRRRRQHLGPASSPRGPKS